MSFLVGDRMESPARTRRALIAFLCQSLLKILLDHGLKAALDKTGSLPAHGDVVSKDKLKTKLGPRIAGFGGQQSHAQVDIVAPHVVFEALLHVRPERENL